jgi:hypothetical protein
MGYDQTSHETETSYIQTTWIGNDSVTIEVERDSHFSVAWSSLIPAAQFLQIVSQLPDFPTSNAIAYTWSTGRNFECKASDLLLELAGIGSEAFSQDYAFLRVDTGYFALSWQVTPARRESWVERPPLSGQIIISLASDAIDEGFIYRLFANTRTSNLHDYLADKFIQSELESLGQQFKKADWSALLANVS